MVTVASRHKGQGGCSSSASSRRSGYTITTVTTITPVDKVTVVTVVMVYPDLQLLAGKERSRWWRSETAMLGSLVSMLIAVPK